MFRPPYLARVAVGAAVYVVEETRKLPNAAITWPMTAFSQLLQTTMHFQQFMTSLAIKGDQLFSRLEGAQELPEWATFDEDETLTELPPLPERPASSGRFALYSMPGLDEPTQTQPLPDPLETRSLKRVAEPEIAQYLDYGSLTLAQLRARLRALSVDELNELLDYEDRTLARPPFKTMLENRIAAAKAK
ncbi:lipid droplet-associated protein [Skermania sp. ID1734]|uniref:lipid droplet-associated protein n=1 Tax=Skermania sp. ID1734 TaxID=2597516 RepID=UPI0011814819|nr:lipid droplet-associated protein [Skermania sp. ID1734]TSE01974.1 lipid droplet-associated protein [Skermania sp. ID1734]